MKQLNRFTILLFVPVGIILMVAGILGIVSVGKAEDYLKTEGTITEFVEVGYDVEMDSFDMETHITYTVDGKTYNGVYGSYSSSMKVGDKVVVLYDPQDPTRIQAEGSKLVPFVVTGAGALATVGAIVVFLKKKH